MKRKIITVVALLMVGILTLVSCGGKDADAAKVASPDDFAGRSIAVQVATTAADSVNELNEESGDIKISEYEKVIQCFDDLLLDRVDAVYVDSVVAAYYTKDNDEYEMSWLSDEGEPMGLCLNKNNPALAAALEAAVDTLYYDGDMKTLAEEVFGSDFTEGVRTVDEKPVIPKDFTTIKPGTLTVGMEVGYPPMEYLADDGEEFIGFDVEVSKALAAELGLEVEFVNTAWDGIFAGLEKEQYDVIISSVSITPERQEKYILTKPYISNALCIVVKAEKK